MSTEFAIEANKLIAEEQLIFKNSRSLITDLISSMGHYLRNLERLKKFLQLPFKGKPFNQGKQAAISTLNNRKKEIITKIEAIQGGSLGEEFSNHHTEIHETVMFLIDTVHGVLENQLRFFSKTPEISESISITDLENQTRTVMTFQEELEICRNNLIVEHKVKSDTQQQLANEYLKEKQRNILNMILGHLKAKIKEDPQLAEINVTGNTRIQNGPNAIFSLKDFFIPKDKEKLHLSLHRFHSSFTNQEGVNEELVKDSYHKMWATVQAHVEKPIYLEVIVNGSNLGQIHFTLFYNLSNDQLVALEQSNKIIATNKKIIILVTAIVDRIIDYFKARLMQDS